jgi:NAD-reducing hydrogenase large subunit
MSTQKITIEPVTRIEGHAKVTIHMNDNGSVNHAYMHVNEFRGFEKFCEGRLYFEMPQITPRICGICPVSHHLAAAKAGDALTGQTPHGTDDPESWNALLRTGRARFAVGFRCCS